MKGFTTNTGITTLAFWVGVFSANGVFADENHDHLKEAEPVGGTARVLHLAGEHNVNLGASFTTVIQGVEGTKDGFQDDGGITYSADVALEGDFGELGSGFIYINSAQGEGVLAPVATGVNADNETGSIDEGGYSETRIAEAWFQFNLGDHAALTVGKIDPTGIYDGNEVANDETRQFLADGLVNNAAVAFPGYTAGVSLSYAHNEHLVINLGAFENEDDFSGDLGSSFLVSELVSSMSLSGMPTNLRFLAWQEDGSDNNGFAFNSDIRINHQLGMMLRFGVQEDSEPFDQAISVAGQYFISQDIIGAGVSHLSATEVGAEDESHFEVYYNHAITEHVRVTADVQAIMNAGFNGDAADVFVYGLRTQIDF